MEKYVGVWESVEGGVGKCAGVWGRGSEVLGEVWKMCWGGGEVWRSVVP